MKNTKPQNKTPLPPGEYSTVQGLAAALEIHRSTLWRRVKAGKMPQPTKSGRQKLFNNDEVVSFVSRSAGGSL